MTVVEEGGMTVVEGGGMTVVEEGRMTVVEGGGMTVVEEGRMTENCPSNWKRGHPSAARLLIGARWHIIHSVAGGAPADRLAPAAAKQSAPNYPHPEKPGVRL